jgi:hypothetical protein
MKWGCIFPFSQKWELTFGELRCAVERGNKRMTEKWKRYERLIHCLEKFAWPGDTLQPEWHSPDEIIMALRFIERLEWKQEQEEQKEQKEQQERQWRLTG